MSGNHVILFTLLSYSVIGAGAECHAAGFDPNQCKDVQKVAQELIELELSGKRWQGGDSRCLIQKKFARVKVSREPAGDFDMLKPAVVLSKGRDLRIDPPILNPITDIYTVKYYYLGKGKKGEPVNASDSIQFSIYGKGTIQSEGCAMLIEQPQTFAMREECEAESD